ncbi:MAG: hypothetical protein OHK0039_15960 [Bacteroidia bacterium]
MQFADTVMTSMIVGKKVMHLGGKTPFEFLPGQALIMPARERMEIDFPEATLDTPTQCLALTISSDFIRESVEQFNHYLPRLEAQDQWALEQDNYHFFQSQEMSQTLRRLVQLFRENHVAKDFFATNTLKELLLRVMQTQARHLLIDQSERFASHHRLAFAVHYIRQHLDETIKIERLCDKACLSKAQFFRAFKREFGLSPIDFVNRERVRRAQRILAQPGKTPSDACYSCGFNSLSYFNRVFKRWTGLAPSAYQKELTGAPATLPLSSLPSAQPRQRPAT